MEVKFIINPEGETDITIDGRNVEVKRIMPNQTTVGLILSDRPHTPEEVMGQLNERAFIFDKEGNFWEMPHMVAFRELRKILKKHGGVVNNNFVFEGEHPSLKFTKLLWEKIWK